MTGTHATPPAEAPPEAPLGAAPMEHRAVLVLVLGILSVVTCSPLGVAAWIMGRRDLTLMASGRMDAEGKQLTQAGMICGIVGACILGVQILIFIAWIFFAFFMLMAAASAPF